MNDEPVSYMTALQLADFIDANVAPFMNDHQMYLDYATVMLRQQQAEIEALKLQLHTTLTNRDLRTYDGKLDMNNEPVAWMQMTPNKQRITKISFVKTWEDDVPLYTYPAKTLTDEEILDVERRLRNNGDFCELHFARAILRKAQEK